MFSLKLVSFCGTIIILETLRTSSVLAQAPSSQPSSSPTFQPFSQPTVSPSLHPTAQPSKQPDRHPSLQPSSQPTSQPSCQPTLLPISHPSSQPTLQPSTQPITHPTTQPSVQPSQQPSFQPSKQPQSRPSSQPSYSPSSQPTVQPAARPSVQPSEQPVSFPSSQPSISPSTQPSTLPTCQPSTTPSDQPTTQPSQPSGQPSSQPTGEPSSQPSTSPTNQPIGFPTSNPSNQPTSAPSHPTSQPSSQPTVDPTAQPTCVPSIQPSSQPSSRPSSSPTQPSGQPTSQPTCSPSLQPSLQPVSVPTQQPSGSPSAQPLTAPSIQPAAIPSSQPTSLPSFQPSMQPTSVPTNMPSIQPTSFPTIQPTGQPTVQPSVTPSSKPSRQPSSQPTSQPSKQPSAQPSISPSSDPTFVPTSQPTACPTTLPSSQPSGFPSSQPTSLPTIVGNCSAGTYYVYTGDRLNPYICTACPAGEYSGPKSPKCKNCPAGSFSSSGVDCLECPFNSYSQFNNSRACTQCEAGLTNSGTGNSDPISCANPLSNIIFGFVALLVVIPLLIVYVAGGRLQRMAFVRREILVKRSTAIYNKLLVTLRVIENYCNQLTAIQRYESPWSRRRSCVWDWSLTFFMTFLILLIFLWDLFRNVLSLFTISLLIWQGYNVVWPVQFYDQIELFVEQIGIAIQIRALNIIFYPFLKLLDFFAQFNVSFASINVLCVGAQAPLYLLLNCCIMFVVTIIVDSDLQVYWNTAYSNTHNQYMSLFLQRQFIFRRENMCNNFINLIISALMQLIPPPIRLLQYTLGLVSVIQLVKVVGSDNCDAVVNLPGIGGADTLLSYLAAVSFICAIPWIFYMMSQVLVPQFNLLPHQVRSEKRVRKHMNRVTCPSCQHHMKLLDRIVCENYQDRCDCINHTVFRSPNSPSSRRIRSWKTFKSIGTAESDENSESPLSQKLARSVSRTFGFGEKTFVEPMYGCCTVEECNYVVCELCYSNGIESAGESRKSQSQNYNSITKGDKFNSYGKYFYSMSSALTSWDSIFLRFSVIFPLRMQSSMNKLSETLKTNPQIEKNKVDIIHQTTLLEPAKKYSLAWFYALRKYSFFCSLPHETKDDELDDREMESQWIERCANTPSYFRMMVTVRHELMPKYLHKGSKCGHCNIDEINGVKYTHKNSGEFLCDDCMHNHITVYNESDYSRDSRTHDWTIFSIIIKLCVGFVAWTLPAIGYWTDNVAKEFNLFQKFELFESESEKVESSVAAQLVTLKFENDVNLDVDRLTDDCKNAMNHESQNNLMSYQSSLISTRIVLLQLIPFFTIFSILTVDMASSPLMLKSHKLKEKLPPFCLSPRVAFIRAKTILIADKNHDPNSCVKNVKVFFYAIFLFVHESRAVLAAISVINTSISVAIVYGDENTRTGVALFTAIYIFILSWINCIESIIMLFKTLIPPHENSKVEVVYVYHEQKQQRKIQRKEREARSELDWLHYLRSFLGPINRATRAERKAKNKASRPRNHTTRAINRNWFDFLNVVFNSLVRPIGKWNIYSRSSEPEEHKEGDVAPSLSSETSSCQPPEIKSKEQSEDKRAHPREINSNSKANHSKNSQHIPTNKNNNKNSDIPPSISGAPPKDSWWNRFYKLFIKPIGSINFNFNREAQKNDATNEQNSVQIKTNNNKANQKPHMHRVNIPHTDSFAENNSTKQSSKSNGKSQVLKPPLHTTASSRPKKKSWWYDQLSKVYKALVQLSGTNKDVNYLPNKQLITAVNLTPARIHRPVVTRHKPDSVNVNESKRNDDEESKCSESDSLGEHSSSSTNAVESSQYGDILSDSDKSSSNSVNSSISDNDNNQPIMSKISDISRNDCSDSDSDSDSSFNSIANHNTKLHAEIQQCNSDSDDDQEYSLLNSLAPVSFQKVKARNNRIKTGESDFNNFHSTTIFMSPLAHSDDEKASERIPLTRDSAIFARIFKRGLDSTAITPTSCQDISYQNTESSNNNWSLSSNFSPSKLSLSNDQLDQDSTSTLGDYNAFRIDNELNEGPQQREFSESETESDDEKVEWQQTVHVKRIKQLKKFTEDDRIKFEALFFGAPISAEEEEEEKVEEKPSDNTTASSSVHINSIITGRSVIATPKQPPTQPPTTTTTFGKSIVKVSQNKKSREQVLSTNSPESKRISPKFNTIYNVSKSQTTTPNNNKSNPFIRLNGNISMHSVTSTNNSKTVSPPSSRQAQPAITSSNKHLTSTNAPSRKSSVNTISLNKKETVNSADKTAPINTPQQVPITTQTQTPQQRRPFVPKKLSGEGILDVYIKVKEVEQKIISENKKQSAPTKITENEV